MLTGTETSPKEIVAVAIERAGMVEGGKGTRDEGRGKREAGSGKREKKKWLWTHRLFLFSVYSRYVTKIFNVSNFWLSNFYAGHLWPQVVNRRAKAPSLLQTL